MDSAKRIIKAKHAGVVSDVRMYTTKSMDKLSPSLFNIFDEYFKNNIKKRKILDKHDKTNSVYKLDTLYSLPTEPLKGNTIKGQTCDVLIEIYIEHADEASVGDKLAVYAASKQIISEVVPEGLEPFSETRPDEEISVFVSSTSCLRRMIASPILIGSANKVMIELKRQLEEIYNS
jgi:DNA-directed RNA polymerase beta subunit